MEILFKQKTVAAGLLGVAMFGTAGCGGGGSSSSTPSPSVNQIVLCSERDVPNVDAGEKLFTVNLDGSNLTYIPTIDFQQVDDVEWFPGRQEIVYADFVAGKRGGGATIRRLDRSGTNNREIVPAQSTDPSISPNGRHIAYTSFRGASEIFVANSDGTNRRRLDSGTSPSWSPDGRRIAYGSLAPEGSGTSNFNLFVMNPDGTNKLRVTTSSNVDVDPQFSPDGSRIVYVSISKGNNSDSEIYVTNINGTNSTRLTNSQGLDYNPRWTLDGNRIVFISRRDGQGQIYVMNPDGSNQKPLFNTLIQTNKFDLR